ncbi:nucleotidyltransferase domain-containing protein [Candidatus Pacearchaeota archaeon]|nr:nucleotidyltransferase domain-containing protein [Candidatus Pacearchaeota archaeon]
METKVTSSFNVLKAFFESPNESFHIRELSRILNINHTSIMQQLKKLVKEGYLALNKGKIYSDYRLVNSRKMLNLKLYYNLEKLRESEIIEEIERIYDLPIIILFGSYATATDDVKSDIDISVISNIDKDLKTEKYEKLVNRKISIHRFSKLQFERMKKTNPDLINSLCNGIILSGKLEVI